MRFGRKLVAGLSLVLSLSCAACAASPAPAWSLAPSAQPTPPLAGDAAPGSDPPTDPSSSPSPVGDPQVDPLADPLSDTVDPGEANDGVDPTQASLSPNSGNIQVYPDQPSVLPGQTLRLHTSTSARSYALTITREGAPTRVVYRHAGYVGHDYASRLTRAPQPINTVNANWPVSVTVSTQGWLPGVYTVDGRDSNGRTGGGIFVVRSPVAADPATAMFVLPVMDYQAYNGWGVANFYAAPRSKRAMTVSWDRPYNVNGGLSFFPRYDRYTLRWLEGHGYPLTYTTDYDLATNPPATAPRVMVLGQHTEYVNKALYDYVDTHVNTIGDMSVAYFGANSFYWQVRMSPDPRGAGRPQLMTCYKDRHTDPMYAVDPILTTVKWRMSPVSRPENRLFGAQYIGIVSGGHTPRTMTVGDTAPAWALAGTGWSVGTQLRGLLVGETDAPSGVSPGTPIMTGSGTYGGGVIYGMSSFWVSPAGARVFDAATFAFGGALGGRISLGVSQASFDQYARNIMDWLGMPAR